MDIKSIINKAKNKKLLNSNPEVRQIAEVVIGEVINDTINELTDKIETALIDIKSKSLKGDDGHTPIKGKDYFTNQEIEEIKEAVRPIKGRDYRDGEDYVITDEDRKEIADQIDVPIVEKVVEIKEPIITEVAKYEEPEAIAEKLNTLTEKVDMKVIRGLDKWLNSIKKLVKDKNGSGGGGDIVEYYDLTSQCNGATKTFTVPSNRKIIGVFGTQFPINLRPGIDWTGSGTNTLTLTSEVSAPETGQTLWIIYIR